jgi:hypothetical protein
VYTRTMETIKEILGVTVTISLTVVASYWILAL